MSGPHAGVFVGCTTRGTIEHPFPIGRISTSCHLPAGHDGKCVFDKDDPRAREHEAPYKNARIR